MSNDRISCLPDSLVSHILSFLPTKDAVATSVLSKRWKPMWRSTTTLDFNENAHRKNGEQQRRRHFVEFVYAILLSRDVQPIKRFRLCCMASAICNSSVNKWINHALESQVEHLEISLTTYDDGFKDVYMDFLMDTYDGVLPSISTIFTRNSLVVLKLKWLEFKPLSSVSLPALKDLHLEFCVFPDYRCLRTILSGCCTLLETLILKSVDITNLELTPSQLFSFYHAANYRISFPKLLSARIALITFRELCNIEVLRFLRLDVDCCPGRFDYSCISTFPNLIHLEICFFEAYWWDVASHILWSTPKLRILSLLLHKETRSLDEDYYFVPLKLPSSLTECRMVGFQGKKGEMQFVKFVMLNATNLQAFTIRCDVINNRSGYKLKLKIEKELSSYPRSSSTCRLLFE